MPKIIATKEDWVLLGYKLFAEQGITSLVVEKMASHLKVNKSSFYWHFKTKSDFLNEIISHWVTSDTNSIISALENIPSPKGRFDKLVELGFKKEPYLDFIFHLKRYAIKNKKIQLLIDEIDNRRMDFTKGLLVEMGFSIDVAEVKSKLFYKYLIGYHEMIRYKKQSNNYIEEVKIELNQFIKY